MIKAIIFDFDGLILDTETIELQSFRELYEGHGVPFPEEEWLEKIGTALSYDPYAALCEACPERERSEFKRTRERQYDALIQTAQLREGVVDYIKQARDMGLAVCIASSSPRSWIEWHLDMIGMSGWFDVISCADDVSEVKPNPAVYQNVLVQLNLGAEEALVFEDSPNGSLAAINAGIQCVVVPNDTTRHLTFSDRTLLTLQSKQDMSLPEVLAHIKTAD
ncbi:HAD family phosphatase [Thalassobacillus sp. CUG 92003]|uniref:HAD family hydrolase n=1 Tax=Thalassobacillus sp. CUG 92003 TaxID=2736641 RepID=UPI0015E645A4|nr:HAD-IA family hydrolase [Thalassobacillus sp. CUG 92003]